MRPLEIVAVVVEKPGATGDDDEEPLYPPPESPETATEQADEPIAATGGDDDEGPLPIFTAEMMAAHRKRPRSPSPPCHTVEHTESDRRRRRLYDAAIIRRPFSCDFRVNSLWLSIEWLQYDVCWWVT